MPREDKHLLSNRALTGVFFGSVATFLLCLLIPVLIVLSCRENIRGNVPAISGCVASGTGSFIALGSSVAAGIARIVRSHEGRGREGQNEEPLLIPGIDNERRLSPTELAREKHIDNLLKQNGATVDSDQELQDEFTAQDDDGRSLTN